MSFFLISHTTGAANVQISNVIAANPLFNPTAGEEAQLSFYLSQDAEIAVKIFDADAGLIRTIGTKKSGYKGINTILWDGRDAQGNIVADDAYYVVIEATDQKGFTAVYDPTSFSGGKTISVNAAYRAEHITYQLPEACRVRIRIGIPNGPLLRTLIDWEPRQAGSHAESWDGKDESGVLMIKKLFLNIVAQAFTLPENSLITTGSNKDLVVYKLADRKMSAAPHQLLLKNKKQQTAKKNLERHPHYTMSRVLDRAPRFQVKVNSSKKGVRTKQSAQVEKTVAAAAENVAIPTVAGNVSMAVNLEELTGLLLSNQRYEILVYIDYEFFMEDEQGYHPYNFTLDTSYLTNGQHVITFNVTTLTDQVGSGSIIVNVQND